MAIMKPGQIAKTVGQLASEPLETLNKQVGKPMLEEFGRELGGFFGMPGGIDRAPQTIAQEDLQRARNEQKINEMKNEDEKASQENAQDISVAIQQEYQAHSTRTTKEQQQLKEEVANLQGEIVKLAQVAGIDTKAHLETMPKKVGGLDIRRLTAIVRYLRIKAEESKSAKELVAQRSNAKRPTGMLAWVSGKQMKVHEQGTLLLQG